MLKKVLAVAGLATVMTVGMNNAFAQPGGGGGGFGGGPGGGMGGPGGNFDPAEMRQRMSEMMREQLGITNDDEWKVIEPKLTAVTEARQATGGGGRGGMMGMGRNRGGNRGGGDNANADQQGQGNARRNRGGQQSAAADALRAAIEAKAPAAEIKTKLDAYRADLKSKEAALEKAQEDLKKIVTAQQEAILVLSGYLK